MSMDGQGISLKDAVRGSWPHYLVSLQEHWTFKEMVGETKPGDTLAAFTKRMGTWRESYEWLESIIDLGLCPRCQDEDRGLGLDAQFVIQFGTAICSACWEQIEANGGYSPQEPASWPTEGLPYPPRY
jgi:hypothetical protein